MSKHILFSIKTSKREVWGCLFLSKFAFLDQQQKHLSLHTPTKTLFGPHVHLGEDPSKRMLHSGQLFWSMCSGQCVLVNVFWSTLLVNILFRINTFWSSLISDLWSAGGREEGCQCQPSFSIVGEIFEIRFKLKHLRQK